MLWSEDSRLPQFFPSKNDSFMWCEEEYTAEKNNKKLKLSKFFHYIFKLKKKKKKRKNNTVIALFCTLTWAQPRSSLRLYARELNVSYLLNLSIFLPHLRHTQKYKNAHKQADSVTFVVPRSARLQLY